MPLVVVGPCPVLREVERVDGRAEERLSHVVHRLRIRVGDPVLAPAGRPLHERHVEAVVVGLRLGGVLAVVRVGRVRAAAVVVAGRHAARHVLVDGQDEVLPAQVLVADADRGPLAELVLDLEAGLAGVRVLQAAVHGREVDEGRGGDDLGQDVGEDRGPGLGGRQADPDLAQAGRGRSCSPPRGARWPAPAAGRGRRRAPRRPAPPCGGRRTASTRTRSAARRCSRPSRPSPGTAGRSAARRSGSAGG